jgi:predicted GNAT family acetyltransferase
MTASLSPRPVWDALTTRDAAFALGGERARRFAPDIAPFAAAGDDSRQALDALAELVPATGELLLLQADTIAIPRGTVAVTTADAVQMVAERAIAPADGRAPIERLTEADAPAMLALATLTRPGPFGPRTHALGEFWGVKAAGVLVAMAGERMKHDGFTELSGVCTHPDARGRGLARALSIWVSTRIAARGDTPYLHAYASNAAAIALYRSIGFAIHRRMHVVTLARRTSP